MLAKHLLPLTPDVLTVEEARTKFMPEYYLQSFYDGNLYALGCLILLVMRRWWSIWIISKKLG